VVVYVLIYPFSCFKAACDLIEVQLMKRRTFIQTAIASAATTAAVSCANRTTQVTNTSTQAAASGDDIKVGVLFSLTGGLAIIEKSLHDATLMAIDEVNAAGGVGGAKLVPIVEDAASDPRTYQEKARKLLISDNVTTVFGCYTSASRKAVLPIFQQRKGLLYYPTYYEGNECSGNCIYTGAVPNQQQSNFVPWIVENLNAKRFFIVGSNYVYPREMSKVCQILLKENGGQVVADEYLPLGHTEWAPLVNRIRELKPDIVYSNVVGDSVIAFYREFRNQGLTAESLPICATVTSEIEVAAMGAEFAAGHYTSFPYFQAIQSPTNTEWVKRVKERFGQNAVTHHAMECSYWQVHVFKQAAEQAGDLDPMRIREATIGQTYDAPVGKVVIDDNAHAFLTPRIAQAQSDGQFRVVDEYPEPLEPLPYSAYGETSQNKFCMRDGLDQEKAKAVTGT
jgi:urea transport system substrate-binding protein